MSLQSVPAMITNVSTLKWLTKNYIHIPHYFVCLCNTDYLPDHHKKFQAASKYDTKVKCKIWNFFCKLFWIYAVKINILREREQLLKMGFSNSGDLKTCKSIKISTSKIWPKTILSLPCMMDIGERKKVFYLFIF